MLLLLLYRAEIWRENINCLALWTVLTLEFLVPRQSSQGGLNQPKNHQLLSEGNVNLYKVTNPAEQILLLRAILRLVEIPSTDLLFLKMSPNPFNTNKLRKFPTYRRIGAPFWDHYLVRNENSSFCLSITDLLRLNIQW